jgi:hypothetical protein
VPRDRIELPTRGFSEVAKPCDVIELHRQGATGGAAKIGKRIQAIMALRPVEGVETLLGEALVIGLNALIFKAVED